MKTRPSIEETRNEFKNLAFKQFEQFETTIDSFFALLEKIEHADNHERLELMLESLAIAQTIRPPDLKGIAQYLCELLPAGKPIPKRLIVALNNFCVIPPAALQEHIAHVEREVEKGDYNRYITDIGQGKYDDAVKEMLKNDELHQSVADFNTSYPEFCSSKKVRRRGLYKERGFSPDTPEFTGTEKDLTRVELESICYHHCLFGLDDYGKTPMLQKLSVNVTPYGVMIFIPRYWRLDYKRDFNWKEITKLLKCWGIVGEDERSTRLSLLDSYRRSHLMKLQGQQKGFSGDALYAYIIEKAGLNKNIDHANVRKYCAKGKKLCKGMAAKTIT